MRAALALAALLSPSRAQWACPPSARGVPPAFLGAFSDGGATFTLTPSAVFYTPAAARAGDARCVLSAFANPNAAAQLFLTYGNAANAANDTDTGCAILDLSDRGAARWAESLAIAPCPLAPAAAVARGAWTAPAPAPAACAARAAAVPRALRGAGALPDATGAAPDGLLAVSAAAWSTVAAGSFAAPGCVVGVADAGKGVTALTLSARADGRAEACVWARPGAGGATLLFKNGTGAGCPADFGGATEIPFAFGGGAQASS